MFLGELPESTFVVGITVLYSSLHVSTEPLLYIYLSTLLLISPALHKRRGAIGLHEHLQSPILAMPVIWNFQYLSEWNPNPINIKLFIIQYVYCWHIFHLQFLDSLVAPLVSIVKSVFHLILFPLLSAGAQTLAWSRSFCFCNIIIVRWVCSKSWRVELHSPFPISPFE